MEQSKNTADKIRPILQAMERSIDQARQDRTGQRRAAEPAGEREMPQAATPPDRPCHDAPADREKPAKPDDPKAPARPLKARPKRPGNVNPLSSSSGGQSPFQWRTG